MIARIDETGQAYFDTPQGYSGAPLVSSDGRLTLALCGNVRNVQTVCAALGDASAGENAASAVLRLWRHKGSLCLPELDGAFALAVWDQQERSLTLARDRFGLKPLYYALHEGGIACALDAVSIAPRPLRPNANALFHYLTVQSVPAPLSAFQGVHTLPQAHCLVWRPFAAPDIRRYWTPHFTHAFAGTLDDAASELESLLKKAVRHCANTPRAGALLSGGVDSSLMVALLCGMGHAPDTFTVGFAEQSFDERPFAREVAQMFGTAHHEMLCDEALPPLIERIVASYVEPFADSSALSTGLALRAARETGCCLAVLGDGGDDLFAGYERHLNPFIPYEAAQDTRALHLKTEMDGYPEYAPLAAAITARNALAYTHWARFWGPLKKDLCGEVLRNAAHPPASVLLARGLFEAQGAPALLDAVQCFELDYYLPCTLTTKVEVPARACGLHTAAPFLTNAVADFALSLPTNYRVGPGDGPGSFACGFETKRVVKLLAERYLPEHIVYRRKMGFGVPLAHWLRGPLRELLHDTLLGQSCVQRGWLDPRTVRRLLAEHMQGQAHWHYPLWALLMLELWAQTFLDAPHAGEKQ